MALLGPVVCRVTVEHRLRKTIKTWAVPLFQEPKNESLSRLEYMLVFQAHCHGQGLAGQSESPACLEGTPSSHGEEGPHCVPGTGLGVWISWRGRNTKIPALMSMRGGKTGYKRWRSKWYKMLRIRECEILTEEGLGGEALATQM